MLNVLPLVFRHYVLDFLSQDVFDHGQLKVSVVPRDAIFYLCPHELNGIKFEVARQEP